MNTRYSEQKNFFTYGTEGFTVTSFDCKYIDMQELLVLGYLKYIRYSQDKYEQLVRVYIYI